MANIACVNNFCAQRGELCNQISKIYLIGCHFLLHIKLTRRSNGTIKCSIHRKVTWNVQHIHFASFTPTAYKNGLVKTSYHLVKDICTADALREEWSLLGATLICTSYPENFVFVHSWQKPKGDPIYKPTKKAAYFRLTLKGDLIPNDVRRKLGSAVSHTFPAADLRILTTTERIILDQRGSNHLSHSASHLVYQLWWHLHWLNGPKTFTANVRTYSQLVSQITVNSYPDRNARSSITKRMVTTKQTVDPLYT